MQFEWDEDKRLRNIQNHKVDLLLGAAIFDGPVLTQKDTRHDYGETRFVSVGLYDGQCLVVVHTEREGRIRLISTRKGGRRDRRRYQASLA